MNHTLDKATVFSCGFPFLVINAANVSPDLGAIFVVRIAANVLTCPLIIVINILVIVAAKTKRQLRTKSNVAITCLSTTDLAAGLVVQPLHIASSVLLFKGKTDAFCSLLNKSNVLTRKRIPASLYHLFLISFERYIAINTPSPTRTRLLKVVSSLLLVWRGQKRSFFQQSNPCKLICSSQPL